MKKTNPSGQIVLLLQVIDEGYSKKAWHGPNLLGSIRGVTPKQASWRPSPERHNIWENVVHCAYWKYVVRRRILGEKKGSFPVNGSNWFKRPEDDSEDAWKQDIQLLDDMNDMMVDAVDGLKLSDLSKKVWGSWSAQSTLYGIAMHDVYHAGQIQLLKRLMK